MRILLALGLAVWSSACVRESSRTLPADQPHRQELTITRSSAGVDVRPGFLWLDGTEALSFTIESDRPIDGLQLASAERAGEGGRDSTIQCESPEPTGSSAAPDPSFRCAVRRGIDGWELVVRFVDESSVSVPLLYVPSGPRERVLPLAVISLTLICVGLTAFTWWRLRNRDADLQRQLHSLKSVIERTAAAFDKAPTRAPAGAGSAFAPASSRAHVEASPPPPSMRDDVLHAAMQWRETLGVASAEFDKLYQRLERLPLATDAQTVGSACHGLVVAALTFSDESADQHAENAPAQRALRTLVDAAGLELMEPRRRERYDSMLHETVGRSTPEVPGDNQTVSAVVRRGLRDGRQILQKAQVRIFYE